jgi:hypothetical protein
VAARSGPSQSDISWDTGLDGAVNKRLLSTGETREFASENVGARPQPWG